jgi:hypothetical protein
VPIARWNSGALDDLAHKGVGIQQDIEVKKNVINADDPVAMQRHVIQKGRPLVQGHAQPVMQIVIKIGPGGNDPIHEPRAHQRDQARFAQAGRSQGARQAQADDAVVGQHFFRQQFGRLAQASAVVGQERFVHQIGGGHVFADARRIQTRVAGKLGHFTHGPNLCGTAAKGNRKWPVLATAPSSIAPASPT